MDVTGEAFSSSLPEVISLSALPEEVLIITGTYHLLPRQEFE
jgi:hypothetical protein